MATLTITNTFTAGTEAIAADVNQNFTDVRTFVNSQVVHKDGTNLPFSVTPTITSTASTAVSLANHLTNKAYVDAEVAAEKADVLANGQPVNTVWSLRGTAATTAGQTVTATSYTNVTNTGATVAAVDDRAYRVQAQFTLTSNTGTDQLAYLQLVDSLGNTISSFVHKFFVSSDVVTGYMSGFAEPGVGSVTYSLKAKTTAGGSFTVNAAFVSVEDAGESSGAGVGLAEV